MKHVLPIALAIGLILQSCQVEPQDPKLIFNTQQALPASLAAIANPNPNSQSALLAHLQNKSQAGRVGVAVIDNGVDYLHRDLVSQIRFHMENGQVTGAGYDAFGGDNAGHSNLINPGLFALMAQKVEFGQLTNVQGDPLTWMNQVQAEFSQTLYANLAADTKLVGSLAAVKLNTKVLSFFVLAIPGYLKDWQTDYSKKFKRFQEDGKLLTYKESLEPLYREYGKFAVDQFLNEPWTMYSQTGLPSEIRNNFFFRYIDAERIVGHLTQAFNTVNARHNILARLENYGTYRNAINTALGTSPASSRVRDLARAWFYSRNFTAASPILETISFLCESFNPETIEQLRNPQLNPDQRFTVFRGAIIKNLNLVAQISQRRLKIETMNDQERKDLEKSLTKLGSWQIMLDEIFTQRPYLRNYLTCQKDLLIEAKHDAGLAQFVQARKHPYLSATSESESHGTHVSGIIARQSGGIEIVPVRVVTSSNPPLPRQVQALRTSFERGFSVWLANTQIANGIGSSRIATGIFGHALSQSELAAGMKKFLDEEMLNNYLDFTFFDQIKKAIQYVGTQKIKVANMSLGTNFNKAILTPDKKDFEALVKSFYTFVMYEYYKFDVALAIQQYARNTLFVIAAGNDGAWLDGNSKSGLPCDLSSPVLANVPNLPNNQIKNILCVGSMDDQKLLSSFTNIPLTAVPFVLSYGEAILSPIKTTDCEGATSQYLNQLGGVGLLPSWELDETDARYDDLLKASGYWRVDPFNPDLEKERSYAHDTLESGTMNISYLQSAMTQHRCMKTDKNNMGRMSGTSMATPAVAGFIAKTLVKKINSDPSTRSLTDAQVYDKPELAPEKIIADLISASPAFGGSSLVKNVKMIPEIMKWKPHPSRVNQMVGVRVTELLRSN